MSPTEAGYGRIFLLRHGETEWSATGRHTGRTDVPLTERGHQVAVAAGRVLAERRGSRPPAIVLTSPRRRAMDTAELAGLAAEIDDRLVEWDYGEYEGLTTPRIRQTVPGWTVWTHPCPGGENAGDVSDRADGVLARCRRVIHATGTDPAGTDTGGGDAAGVDAADVVLVGHGHFSRVLTARWLGLPATAGVGFKLDAGGLTVLGDERGVPRLDHVNLVELAPS